MTHLQFHWHWPYLYDLSPECSNSNFAVVVSILKDAKFYRYLWQNKRKICSIRILFSLIIFIESILKYSIIWCSKQSWWNLWPQGNMKNGFTNKYPEQIAHSSCPSMTTDRLRNVCKSLRTRSADLADSSMSMRCSWIFALYSYVFKKIIIL